MDQASRFFNIPKKSVQNIGIGRVNVDGSVRYDRKAFDLWLDRQSGIDTHTAELNDNADAALERFSRNQERNARRP